MKSFFRRRPPIGTAENPEIIMPGSQPQVAFPNRFYLAVQALRWMVSVSLPAVIFSILWLWLLDLAKNQDFLIAWIALVLISIPTAVACLVAVLADTVLFFFITLTLFGKRTPQWGKFAKFNF